MGPPERRSQRVRTLGMRSRRFSGPARSENIAQNYGPAAFFGVPSAFPSRRLNGINVDIFRLRFRGEKKMMALGSWHNVFAFRCRRPSG